MSLPSPARRQPSVAEATVVTVRNWAPSLENMQRTGLLYFSLTIRPTRSTVAVSSATLATSWIGVEAGIKRRHSANLPSSRRQIRVAFSTEKEMCFFPRVNFSSSSVSERIFSNSFRAAEGTTKLMVGKAVSEFQARFAMR